MPLETATAIKRLKAHPARLTRQQYSTLKGQVLAGDSDGAMRGLDKILRRSRKKVETLDDTERGNNGFGSTGR